MRNTTKYLLPLFYIAFALLNSCSGDSSSNISESDQNITLRLIDTLGVDNGEENYVFGNIIDAVFLPDGRIALLDVLMNRVSIFSSNGEFIASFGTEGNGPGEFTEPVSIAVLSNDVLAVCDNMHRKVVFFDSEYVFIREIRGFEPLPPTSIENGVLDSFVGMQSHYFIESGVLNMGVRLGSWSQTVEPDVVYSAFYTVPTDNTAELYSVRFCTDSQGRVYTAPTSYEEYSVTCYSAEGDTLFQIAEPYNRTEKTQEEIEYEHMCYRFDTPGFDSEDKRAIASRWEPDPYRLAIENISTDYADRIWVQTGRSESNSPNFRVYDSNGNWLASVETDLPIESLNYNFVFGRDRVLAFDTNPSDYSKIYILELAD
ncbi:MAG: 6-bladed beta-propeller [Candidatus Sabulitectum sp.]|nr:6-bladed beta-propeller [Candidatus Sabulitectum sp.]